MSLPETARPTAIRIFSGSHRCEIDAGPYDDVTVTGRATVDQGADRWTVDDVRGTIRVRVPEGVDVVVGSSSGRIEVSGPAGAVSASSDSGRIAIEAADTVDARTDSSRVEIGQVAGNCRVRTASGRVIIQRCGSADIATESSRIVLGDVHGPVQAHTVSGRIEIGLAEPADVDAETVSGRISVSLPGGTVVHRPEPGDSTPRPADCDCTVRARTTSGRVVVATR